MFIILRKYNILPTLRTKTSCPHDKKITVNLHQLSGYKQYNPKIIIHIFTECRLFEKEQRESLP